MASGLENEFATLHEIVKAARIRLTPNIWDYLIGGTETETTLRRNRLALDAIAFKPRVLRDVVTPMGAQAREKGLGFEALIPDSLPTAVRLDPTRTRQVLFNLLSNAIKFTEHGSVGFEVAVQPGLSADTIELVFTVRDTGIGMSAESVARLFERFYRFWASIIDRRSHTGH